MAEITPIGLTYPALEELRPCPDGMARVTRLLGGSRKWSGRVVTASEARSSCAEFDDLVWVASAMSRSNKDVDRRLRLWMADCAARVLHIYERQAPADHRVRNAIVAARRFARGEIDAARAAAGAAPWAAAWDAEEAWQFDRLVLWFSDPEPVDWPLPETQQASEVAA